MEEFDLRIVNLLYNSWDECHALLIHVIYYTDTWCQFMMTTSNGNIFGVTGHLWGESTWTVDSPHKGKWCGALMFSLICAWINDWANNQDAGDLRRHRTHYDGYCNVIFNTRSVMLKPMFNDAMLTSFTDMLTQFKHKLRHHIHLCGLNPWPC